MRVTDPDRLARLVALWKSELDWDYDLVATAPATTPRSTPCGRSKVLAFGKGPDTQTRFRF